MNEQTYLRLLRAALAGDPYSLAQVVGISRRRGTGPGSDFDAVASRMPYELLENIHERAASWGDLGHALRASLWPYLVAYILEFAVEMVGLDPAAVTLLMSTFAPLGVTILRAGGWVQIHWSEAHTRPGWRGLIQALVPQAHEENLALDVVQLREALALDDPAIRGPRWGHCVDETWAQAASRDDLIEWLCWNDRQGVFGDEECGAEGIDILTREAALILVLRAMEGRRAPPSESLIMELLYETLMRAGWNQAYTSPGYRSLSTFWHHERFPGMVGLIYNNGAYLAVQWR